MRPSLFRPALIAVTLAFQVACAPRAIDSHSDPQAAKTFQPLDHGSLAAAAVFESLMPGGVAAVDSVWVYQSGSGGWVMHVETRRSGGQSVTAWLEVGAAYQPVRGWQRQKGPAGACEAGFVAETRRVDLLVRPAGPGSAMTLSYGTPSRFAVSFAAPSFLGWVAAAAGYADGPIDVLTLGPCALDPTVPSGFTVARFRQTREDVRPVGGVVFDAKRLVYQQGRGLRQILWVEEGRGLLLSRMTVGSRSGGEVRRVWANGLY